MAGALCFGRHGRVRPAARAMAERYPEGFTTRRSQVIRDERRTETVSGGKPDNQKGKLVVRVPFPIQSHMRMVLILAFF